LKNIAELHSTHSLLFELTLIKILFGWMHR